MEKFLYKLDDLAVGKPAWAVAVVYLTVLLTIILTIMGLLDNLWLLTGGWILLAIPCVIIYAFYLVYVKSGDDSVATEGELWYDLDEESWDDLEDAPDGE